MVSFLTFINPVQSLILHFNQSFHYSIFTLKDINQSFHYSIFSLKDSTQFLCYSISVMDSTDGFLEVLFTIYTTVYWQFHLNIWLHYGSGISTNGSYNINECTWYIRPLRTKAYRLTRNWWPVLSGPRLQSN